MVLAEECTQYGARSGPEAVGVVTLAYLNAESMIDTVRELLEELILIREADLERVRQLVERGVVSASSLGDTEEALLETRIRLEELEPAEPM